MARINNWYRENWANKKKIIKSGKKKYVSEKKHNLCIIHASIVNYT